MKYREFMKKAKLNPKKFRTAFAFETELNEEVKINKEPANLNVYLILQGWKKTAVATMEEYLSMSDKFAADGKFDIVLDGDGEPAVAIEMVDVRIMKFNEVPESFAVRDGESQSLAEWRALMKTMIEQQNVAFSPDMEIVCLDFRKIYP